MNKLLIVVCVSYVLSHVRLLVTPWSVAHQAPPSMEFSRQEYGSGLLFPSPGDLPDPGNEPGSLALQADALPSELLGIIDVIYSLLFFFTVSLINHNFASVLPETQGLAK